MSAFYLSFDAKIKQVMPYKKRKRKKKTYKTNLCIDRFFSKMRKSGTSNSFQNVKAAYLDVLKAAKVPFVATQLPKRSFIAKNGDASDQGFKIFFQFVNDDSYSLFKSLVFDFFKSRFFIKIKRYDISAEGVIAGYVLLRNLDIKKCKGEQENEKND